MSAADTPIDPSQSSLFGIKEAKRLLYDMVFQSIKDLVKVRSERATNAAGAHLVVLDDDEVMSSEWPKTELGREAIGIIFTGAHPDHVVARIYENPQRILDALKSVDLGESETRVADYSIYGNHEPIEDFAVAPSP